MEYAEWKIGNAESSVNQLQKQIDEVDQDIAEGGDNEILSRWSRPWEIHMETYEPPRDWNLQPYKG